MTASYTPRVGDKIRLTRTGKVERIDGGFVTFVGSNGLYHYPRNAWEVELLEAAPVPFEVGKPLTEAMGEPPVGSVIQFVSSLTGPASDGFMVRTRHGWQEPGVDHVYMWSARNPNQYRLVALGDGK